MILLSQKSDKSSLESRTDYRSNYIAVNRFYTIKTVHGRRAVNAVVSYMIVGLKQRPKGARAAIGHNLQNKSGRDVCLNLNLRIHLISEARHISHLLHWEMSFGDYPMCSPSTASNTYESCPGLSLRKESEGRGIAYSVETTKMKSRRERHSALIITPFSCDAKALSGSE